MSIFDKLKKNSTIKETSIMTTSRFFNKKDMIQTPIPAINIALSGSLTGGLTPGLTMVAAPSKHFKSGFSLLLAKSYLDKYPDAALLFYDSEFGTPQSYFTAFGISTDRVIHTPITDIEQLKFDVMNQLSNIERGDHVIIVIDSIGNAASKKEVEDALKQSGAADMSRAKSIKSLFRMITPHLTIKDIPMIAVNHIYMTQELYAKPVVSGGTGSYYSADTIFIVGRQQEKDSNNEIQGYNFIINIEKSRYVKEKSKIPVTITFDGGISKWSGLLEMALDSGHVIKPKVGWYAKVNTETGEISDKLYREKDTDSSDFWTPILSTKSFNDYITNTYQLGQVDMIQSETLSDVVSD